MSKEVRRVIVAGSRDFVDYTFLETALDTLLKRFKENGDIIQIVCGMARGADLLGERYAKENGYEIICYPADWSKYGKRAGHLRNEVMAQNAEYCAVFCVDKSSGSSSMIKYAKQYGLKLRVYDFETVEAKVKEEG